MKFHRLLIMPSRLRDLAFKPCFIVNDVLFCPACHYDGTFLCIPVLIQAFIICWGDRMLFLYSVLVCQTLQPRRPDEDKETQVVQISTEMIWGASELSQEPEKLDESGHLSGPPFEVCRSDMMTDNNVKSSEFLQGEIFKPLQRNAPSACAFLTSCNRHFNGILSMGALQFGPRFAFDACEFYVINSNRIASVPSWCHFLHCQLSLQF